jgi:hypothetical protein
MDWLACGVQLGLRPGVARGADGRVNPGTSARGQGLPAMTVR